MTYSKKRLTVICLVWVAAGAVVLTGSTDVFENPLEEVDIAGNNPVVQEAFGVNDASDNSCPNDNGPCAYPAENYNGGIILGASFLEATDGGLTFFDPDTASGDDPQDGRISTDFLPSDAADANQDFVPVATLGLDVQGVSDFFLYKSWKTGPNVGPSNKDHVNVYIQTDRALLDGPSGDGTVSCRGSPYKKQHCDLVAPVSELSAGGLCFGGSALGLRDTQAFFRGERPTGPDYQNPTSRCQSARDNLDRYPDSDCADDGGCEDIGYWVEDPEKDKCTIEDIVAAVGPTIEGFCLSAADPEADFAGLDFTIEVIEIDDLLIRSHRLAAEQGPDTGENKVLQLGDAGDPDNNFYAEIRWGKGYDRAYWPDSNAGAGWNWLTNEFEDNNPLLEDQTRVSGVANPFPCRGNPTAEGKGWASSGGGDDNAECVQDTENEGTLRNGAYDDIYR